jgi:hypothetical protein
VDAGARPVAASLVDPLSLVRAEEEVVLALAGEGPQEPKMASLQEAFGGGGGRDDEARS